MTSDEDPPDNESEPKVGYRQPPKASRFKKGESGNWAGRPKGRHHQAPHATLFNQMITIHENATERQVTVAEAFMLYLRREAIKKGGGPASRAYMDLIRQDAELRPSDVHRIRLIVLRDGGNISCALRPLRMARVLDRFRETARMVIEPWLVQLALARLDRKLSPAEQRVVLQATRTPKKVRWPEWWSEFPSVTR